MDGGSVIGRLWCGVTSRWKVLLVSIPTALLTGYAVWKIHRRWRQKSIETASSNKLKEDEKEQPVKMDDDPQTTHCLTQSSSQGEMSTKSNFSPTDSGYSEAPCTPLLPSPNNQVQDDGLNTPNCQFSASITPHPLPPTPTGLPFSSLSSGPLDTTAIRGGRARATVQLPIEIVGRFIGRQGKNIKSLMADSGAQIHVQQKNLSKDATIVPCILQGTQGQIAKAIDLICLRHPEVTFPSPPTYTPPISSTPIPVYSSSTSGLNQNSETSWDFTLKPAHVPTSTFLAIVTYIEKLNRVWLVPYSSTQLLEDLHQSMAHAYSKDEEAIKEEDNENKDEEEELVRIDKYCSVRVNEVYWLRGKVIKKSDEGGNYEIKLMDYGSSVIVPLSALKALRYVHTVYVNKMIVSVVITHSTLQYFNSSFNSNCCTCQLNTTIVRLYYRQ